MSTRERIRAFISEAFFVDSFGDEDSFLRTGVLDSMGMLQLIAFLEKEFAVKVKDDELLPENLDSLTRVSAFVERKQQAAA